MPTFDQIKTEYAYGVFRGVDYGSKIRILMRSETHVMFVALGVNLVSRDNSSRNLNTICDRASKANFADPRVAQKIIAVFGEGADKAAIDAVSKRGQGTILVDGGGKPLPLPRAVQARNDEEAFAAETATRLALLPVEAKCRQCGTDLKPSTTHHHMGQFVEDRDKHPRTPEDCQRLTNEPVWAVHSYDRVRRDIWGYVCWFETWDGTSYVDPLFCTSRCAEIYGRRAAQELEPLPIGGHPKFDRNHHQSVDHYDRPPAIITASGLRI